MLFSRKPKETFLSDATPDDVPHISMLHERSFANGWSNNEIEGLMSRPGVQIIVGRQVGAAGGPLHGFVIIRRAADEAEVLSIAVQPTNRRRGLGGDLIRAAIRELQKDGIDKLFLEVSENNSSAVRLYRKLGFRQVGERAGYYRGRGTADTDTETAHRALVMRLDLG